MKTFTFYRDQKVVTWMRDTVQVEAETKEEAIEKLSRETYFSIADEQNGITILGSSIHLYDHEEVAKVGQVIEAPVAQIIDPELEAQLNPNFDEVLWES